MVANLGWVDLNLDVPLSAQLCWGQWEFGRIGWVAKHDDDDDDEKATQSRFATTRVTLSDCHAGCGGRHAPRRNH